MDRISIDAYTHGDRIARAAFNFERVSASVWLTGGIRHANIAAHVGSTIPAPEK
jgi:hypothetical protein